MLSGRSERVLLLIAVLALLAMAYVFLLPRFSANSVAITTGESRSELLSAPESGSSVPDPAQAPYPINVNTAGKEALLLIPDIGEGRAAAIVAHREAHGSFLYPDALLEVEGIGKQTLAEIFDYITLN